ncbi:MAG TPA: hypothetical protein GXZ98_05950 [Firmicutes bacterium]|nr:hypothetical protein [Bacillota bacterium]
MTRKRIWLWLFLPLVFLLTGCETASRNNGSAHVTFLWKMDDETVFTKVNCELSKVTNPVYQCDYSWQLTPTGPSDPNYPEAKLETTFDPLNNPGLFEKWVAANRVFIDVYVPAGSNFNSCFAYVWDEKAYWDPEIRNGWVDGVFQQKVISPGWNRMVLPLTFRIKDLDAARPRTYKIGFGFRHMAEGQEKYKDSGYPLNEVPIYIGGIGVF